MTRYKKGEYLQLYKYCMILENESRITELQTSLYFWWYENRQTGLWRRRDGKLLSSIQLLYFLQRPDNSMEHQSEGLGGDQINDQTVQQSADQDRQNRKRASDRKYLDRKKQKTKDTERELETIKAEKAQLEKSNAYLKGQLDQLKEYVEQVRETHRRLEQIVEGQTTTIHMLKQLLQRPLERTLDNTSAIREAAQPVYNAPVPESGIPMRSDGSTMKNSLGMRRSRVPRGWPYGNGSELPAPTHDLTVDDYLVNDNGVIPVLK